MRITFIIMVLALLVLAGCAAKDPLAGYCKEGEIANVICSNPNSSAMIDTGDVIVGSKDKAIEIDKEKVIDTSGDLVGDKQKPSADGKYAFTLEYKEGDLIELNIATVDPDDDDVKITYSSPLDKEGRWQTREGDAGEYPVEIVASDGKLETRERVLLKIIRKNLAPTIDIKDEIVVKEGETVVIAPAVKDPENDDLTITYSGWMTSSVKETGYDDAGTYTVTITVSDGQNTVAKRVSVVIEDNNRAPVIVKPKDAVTVVEGEIAEIFITASDDDGDNVFILYESPFDREGRWQTKRGDVGTYKVKVTASDGKDETDVIVDIVVLSSNSAPVLEKIDDIKVDEGETISIDVTAKDTDGDDLTIAFSGWMTSSSKITGYDDAGVHAVSISVSDGIETVSQDIKVTVVDKNRVPAIKGPPYSIAVDEGETAEIDIQATDEDGDTLKITFSSPFDDEGVWKTELGDAGDYDIKVTADDGKDKTTINVPVKVIAVNRAPVLEKIEDIIVSEGEAVEIRVRATDIDGDDLTVSFSGWMSSASRQTGYDDSGTYTVKVSVTDGTDTVEQDVKVTVINVNRPPQFVWE